MASLKLLLGLLLCCQWASSLLQKGSSTSIRASITAAAHTDSGSDRRGAARDRLKKVVATSLVPLFLLTAQQPARAVEETTPAAIGTSSLQSSRSGAYTKFDPATGSESDKGGFKMPVTFEYPNQKFTESPKLVKTHFREYFYKAEGVYGFNFGLTADLIRKDISSIKAVYKSAPLLAEKLMDIERNKDGHISSRVLGVAEVPFGAAAEAPAYDIEYVVESTRGLNHFKTRTFVEAGKVFVFTVQCKEVMFNDLRADIDSVFASYAHL